MSDQSHSESPYQSPYNTDTILKLLQLEALDADHFRGPSHFMGSPNVFGGQVLGQSLYAAANTLSGSGPDRRVHSIHALFILAGNHRLPIDYEVERVRDGGSFSTRRVVATQEGRRIFVMSASFQRSEQGLTHQKAAPPSLDPETLPSSVLGLQKNAGKGRMFQPVPVDFRAEHSNDLYNGQSDQPRKQLWVRAPQRLPDNPLLHETLFAYVSDYGFLWTALQPHGVRMGDPRLQIASLDHTIWFHRPFRLDEWLLFAMESPNASGGRGLCLAHVYNQRGDLVATMAQEGLIRLRNKTA